MRFSQEKGFYQGIFRALGIEVFFGIPRHPQSNGLCERMNRSFLQNARALSMDLKTKDWPNLCPMVSWILNSQISSSTGFSPSELFLGRPSWKFCKVPEPTSNPNVETFLEEQLLMQEKACKRLEHIRQKSLSRANKGRTRSSYMKGDYVLIHKSRFPQRKIPKLDSPWLGPYRVHEVHHASLVVMASPTLGGLIKVSLSMVKKWNDLFDNCDEEVEEAHFDMEEEEEVEHGVSNNVGVEIMNDEEMAEHGYYNVEKILKHKYAHGWKFLVKWEGFDMENATWEPLKNFVQVGGVVNVKFKEYCEEKGLEQLLMKIMKK